MVLLSKRGNWEKKGSGRSARKLFDEEKGQSS